jgi:hypothetical protein
MVDYFDQMVLDIDYEFINQGRMGQLRKMDGYGTMQAFKLHLCQSSCLFLFARYQIFRNS